MQDNKDSQLRKFNKKRFFTYSLLILFAVVAVYVLFMHEDLSKALSSVLSVFTPVFYGIAIAYLINPIVKFFRGIYSLIARKIFKAKTDKYKKYSNKFGIFAAVVSLILIILVLIYMILPELYHTIMHIINSVPSWIDEITKLYYKLLEDPNSVLHTLGIDFTEYLNKFEAWITGNLASSVNQIFGYVTTGVMSVVSFITDFVLGICVAIYFLAEKERIFGHIKKITFALFNKENADTVVKTGIHAKTIFNGYIYGRLIGCLIVFAATFIFMTAMGMPYVLLISTLVGVTNFIPLFGPFIGAIPACLILLMYEPMMAIWFAVFTLILQQVEGNILTPLIISDVTGVPPFWVTVAMLVGGGFFGVIGLILSVPIFSVIYYIIKTVIDKKLIKKQLPAQTETYMIKDDGYVDSMFDLEKIRSLKAIKKIFQKKAKKKK